MLALCVCVCILADCFDNNDGSVLLARSIWSPFSVWKVKLQSRCRCRCRRQLLSSKKNTQASSSNHWIKNAIDRWCTALVVRVRLISIAFSEGGYKILSGSCSFFFFLYRSILSDAQFNIFLVSPPPSSLFFFLNRKYLKRTQERDEGVVVHRVFFWSFQNGPWLEIPPPAIGIREGKFSLFFFLFPVQTKPSGGISFSRSCSSSLCRILLIVIAIYYYYYFSWRGGGRKEKIPSLPSHVTLVIGLARYIYVSKKTHTHTHL